MGRILAVLVVGLAFAGQARAHGILIPTEKKLPPLAMLNHHVTITVDDQVAVTRVEQTFRNHTDRELEATYIFPVPKGASVRKFSMWVNGKEETGELVEADKARQIYTSIVQRTQDPGLLEYMGNNLLRLRVFPVPPKGDQKISISYTSVCDSDAGMIEYRYPLKADGKAVSTLEKFSLKLDLKSQHALQNIYSPTHAITVGRPSDRHAVIGFEKDQASLDRDFQLFYTAGAKDVGLTTLTHRPLPGQNGYFMLLVSPRAELSKTQQVPRDMVFVMDTSGSMRGKRMTQAQNALKYCLTNLTQNDRFTVLNFATTVNKFASQLQEATPTTIEAAKKWVDGLEASGGTAINDALAAALDMRPSDPERTFTIVFFTDGRPTIGETNPDKILQNVAKRNSGTTRIFSFGVGDDVNATMLDQLAETTRSVVTYVREAEDIEAKVSSLYSKISNPVLANLKMTIGPDITLSEVYPPELPDLFHGSQLVVLGRYSGKGHAAVKLMGNVGKEQKEFVYELNFAEKTAEDKGFVEDLWARRKVGFLLDQIRSNGEKKELLDEVVTLAKRYGITTPYTSYLIVPDAPVPVAGGPGKGPVNVPGPVPRGLFQPHAEKQPLRVADFAKQQAGGEGKKGDVGQSRGNLEQKTLQEAAKATSPAGAPAQDAKEARDALKLLLSFDKAREMVARRQLDGVQSGQLGVDLSIINNNLRNQTQLVKTASRMVQNRNCIEVGGVWIDDGFDPKMPTVTIKALSKAYFRLLERQPQIREVLQLGNHLVWVTPNNTALIIDLNDGREDVPDADLDRLFVAAKK